MFKLKINNENINALIKDPDNTELKLELKDLHNSRKSKEGSAIYLKNNRNYFLNKSVKIDDLMGEYSENNTCFYLEDFPEKFFKYDDMSKKIFLNYLTEKWETERSLLYGLSTLESAELFEVKYGKSVLRMDNEEVKNVIEEIFNKANYYSMKFKVKIFSDFQEFMINKIELDKSEMGWIKYYKSDSFRKLFVIDEAITKQEVLDLFNVMSNARDGIISLLIFEGVRFTKKSCDEELSLLKSKDVNGRLITVGKGTDHERVLDIGKDTADAIDIAIKEEVVFRNMFGEKEEVPLANSEYLIRQITGSTGKGNKVEGDPMSYRGVYGRIRVCLEQFETNISHKNFSPKFIKYSGQYHYINKYMAEGDSLQIAMRKTLKRYGEWYRLDDESQEARHPINRQKMNRLKKKWEILSNGENSNK